MGFILTKYYNFRNLKDSELKLNAPEVFLIGENGQGKTNFIESIYVLCFGASFRSRHDQRMIHNQEELSVIRGDFTGKDELRKEVSVKIDRKGGKEIRVDSKIVRDRKDIIQNIPCIVFSHQDMEFIIGPPEKRRRFLNQTLSLSDPLFINLLRSYKKLLKSRNILLKERKLNLIETFNQNLVKIGLKIQERREKIVEAFNCTFIPLFKSISGLKGEIKIVYKPSWKKGSSEKEIISYLENRIRKDLSFETTTSGPHRDNLIMLHDGKSFADLASTGQIRMVSLILRVAQSQFFSKRTGRKPILLLDDVLLELDSVRRESFLKALPDYEQAFFTFLPDEKFLKYRGKQTLMYTVNKGEFIRIG